MAERGDDEEQEAARGLRAEPEGERRQEGGPQAAERDDPRVVGDEQSLLNVFLGALVGVGWDLNAKVRTSERTSMIPSVEAECTAPDKLDLMLKLR